MTAPQYQESGNRNQGSVKSWLPPDSRPLTPGFVVHHPSRCAGFRPPLEAQQVLNRVLWVELEPPSYPTNGGSPDSEGRSRGTIHGNLGGSPRHASASAARRQPFSVLTESPSR